MKKQSTYVFLNDKILPLSEAKISIMDRGLLYGDGVFESLRTYQGKPFLLEEHLQRLHQGLKLLKIQNTKMLSLKKAQQIIEKLRKLNHLSEAYIKIIVTRGEATEQGLDPQKVKGKPTIAILAEKLTEYPKEVWITGWKAIISTIRRPNISLSKIKSLNYLANILAKLEAKKVRAQEAFFLDEKNNVVEGTISNLFIIKEKKIYTPPLKDAVLAGVTRGLVIKLAQQAAFAIIEKSLTPKELYTAEECFITFSGAGIIPITSIWKKKIGRGKPGVITKKLMKFYQDVAVNR